MNRSESQDVLTDRLSIVTKRVSRNSFVFHDRYTEWVAMIFFDFFFYRYHRADRNVVFLSDITEWVAVCVFFGPISPSGSQRVFFFGPISLSGSPCFLTDITEWVAMCFFDRYHLVGRNSFLTDITEWVEWVAMFY